MPKTKAKEKMVLISVHIPKQMLDELDELVKQGRFPSRSEAIRIAIRDLLIREARLRMQENEQLDVIVPGR